MGSCCSCEEVEDAVPAGAWAKLGIASVVAAQSMIFGLAINISPPSGTARWILHGALAASALIVFFLAGGPIVRSSWQALKKRRIVFDQLFLLGILAAFGASLHCTLTGVGHVYYEIVAILLAIHTFGGLLTDNRRREALDAAGNLGREFSLCERVGAGGVLESVPVKEVTNGDVVRVSVGGAITVDGIVTEGAAFVRESALTGEPFPVVKREGDEVKAGSHAMDGVLHIRVENKGGGRGLDRLLAALEEARSRPSRLQREADKLASWFLPVVVGIAALTFGFWTWQVSWVEGLFHALAVILVACPCAMGIATPVAIWSALAAFAKQGLVSRNSDLVEKLATIDTVVFDKTGTLGEEAMEVVDFVAAAGFDRLELKAMAASLEASSEHPVAQAFCAFSKTAGPAKNVRVLPGAGIEGEIGGHSLRIGNLSIVESDHRKEAGRAFYSLAGVLPSTHRLYLTVNGVPAAVATLRETLRSGAMEALHQLTELGLTCRVMTGDSAEAAKHHDLPQVDAGLSPESKAALVREIEASGRRVLFVGDGINDSAAMHEAHAAVAIQGGTLMARESADAELAGSHLGMLPGAIAGARKAVLTIRGNLLFAAAYNSVGITLAALGFLHPVAAALIMLASSFTVTWRALREAKPELQKPAVPAKTPRLPRFQKTGWLAPGVAVATLLQGVALSWLGNFPASTATGIVLLFAVAGLGLFALLSLRPLTLEAGNLALMLSVGGLVMLGGWWADAGFDRVVRDGVCLCNCPNSTMGLGLFATWNWMDVSMIAASLPMVALGVGNSRWMCWGAGLVGMLLGMEAATLLAANLPATNPHLNFFAGYGAMLFGMMLGMILACRVTRKLSA
ncbi:MAG: cation-translocating P-type ATPase [Terrimicrobiaceae bacterium]